MEYNCKHHSASKLSCVCPEATLSSFSSSPIFSQTEYMGAPIAHNGSFAGDCACRMHSLDSLKMAGMKVFATVILNSWRRRREVVKRLKERMSKMKNNSHNLEHQLQVCYTLYSDEQERNRNLNVQVIRIMESLNNARSSCECLKNSINSLKADNAVLEQELFVKYKDYETVNTMLSETKSELFDLLVERRDVQMSLCKEQCNNETLGRQKKKLTAQVAELITKNKNMTLKYLSELDKKDAELDKQQAELQMYKKRLIDYEHNVSRMRHSVWQHAHHVKELEQLQVPQMSALEQSNDVVCEGQPQIFWALVSDCKVKTLYVVHLFVFYLLPATPPP